MKIKVLGVYSEDAVKGMKDSSYAARVKQVEGMASQIDSKLIDCDFLGGLRCLRDNGSPRLVNRFGVEAGDSDVRSI